MEADQTEEKMEALWKMKGIFFTKNPFTLGSLGEKRKKNELGSDQIDLENLTESMSEERPEAS